jgi:TRAP-type C4-dicarboxylate transport system permease small subunit
MLTDRLPPGTRRAFELLADALMLLVCGFVTWYGTRLCIDTMGQAIAEIPWMPVGVTYLAIPLGALLTGIFVVERVLAGPQAHRELVRFGESS